MLGSLQALEVIKVITGVGDTLSGRLFLFDATGFTTRTMKVRKDPRNPLNGENPTQTELIDYDQFCGIGVPAAQETVDAIIHELKRGVTAARPRADRRARALWWHCRNGWRPHSLGHGD